MSVNSEIVQEGFGQPSWWQRLGPMDWAWGALVLVGALYTYANYGTLMDSFEVAILVGTVPVVLALGWMWKPMRSYTVMVALLSLAASVLYGAELGRGDSNFFLKYLLSSQSAIMWMSALFVMATAGYWLALFIRSDFTGRVSTALTWSASTMGLIGLMVRWRESYLISADVGHIPVANLYEVFILFAIITGLLYLYYEGRYRNRAMGAFVLTVISASVAFLLWYTFERQAHHIQPLVPALQSYWMKIHVPANFVGYGAFALAAMLGVAYLVRDRAESSRPQAFVEKKWFYYPSLVLMTIGLVGFRGYRHGISLNDIWLYASILVGVLFISMFAYAADRELVKRTLPSLEQLDDVMYKATALGFAFFTVATVLGAMWAADAWGGYWSWDPKETWALIVWLNYAAWLHMRLTKGWRGRPMAWWAIVGLLVTLFAFLGVNMFLSGLHAYGTL